ncbi:Hypothetical predicted protein [Paramuricea clavata]|uniref:Uncharacterized protein n=1 Tax=Paramuricea clavata TaxID=317549 RepID=A0A7D9DAP0_PARCT|nr:Hypothetical predicted protein [Paramuricea clavata]
MASSQDDVKKQEINTEEKHNKYKARYESSSPVKLSKYQLKRNNWTAEDEIHLNKWRRLEEPNAVDVNFDIQEQPCQDDIKPGLTNVTSVVAGETNMQVNVNGRISFQGTIKTILTKGKLLQKQDALFTDNTGTVRLVLWEKDIDRVTSGSSYKLSNVMVREYDQSKYLSLSKKSIIEQVTNIVERKD